MTTYRLPDGAEVRAADSNLTKAPTLANHTWVIHPTLGAISCYTGILTPTLSPLPPEPPNCTMFSNEADAWIRCDEDEIDPKGRWWCTAMEGHRRWSDIAEIVTGKGWRRYVPDPADDAPELPWKGHDTENDTLEVEPTSYGTVRLSVGYQDEHSSKFLLLAPAVATAAGLALLRAAREVQP